MSRHQLIVLERMPPELLAGLERLAARRDESVDGLVIRLLQEAVNEDDLRVHRERAAVWAAEAKAELERLRR